MATTAAVASLVLALVSLASGAPKLIETTRMVQKANHLGLSAKHYVVIGGLELATAAGLVAGLAHPAPGIAAATGLAMLMAGAVVTHLRASDQFKAALPALAVGLAAVVTAALLLSARGACELADQTASTLRDSEMAQISCARCGQLPPDAGRALPALASLRFGSW